ncbi:hypothetical protein O181_129507 [Austropuccinia psidii MF-1]|uniref:Uncharacterized protein n=1 Tax=Austropuccinia psidii MF-1 TaxID=1389203 RepID=A0A9Q3QBJ0_9BASI|nr:hypothetical protein [Austropuccinia psidii MF-1]
MSPSPAHSKHPPTQLAVLMNPTPDPPDEANHMIIPEIYKSEPGFLTQSQHDSHLHTLAIIIQKLENLEKIETNVTLPQNLEMLLTCLNDRINIGRQTETHKKQVSPTPVNQPPHTTPPLSFAAITAGNNNTNSSALPKRPQKAICQNEPQEINRFKKYHIVIRSKFGAPKPFKNISSQEACNKINKKLRDINATCENAPIRRSTKAI